MFLSYWQILTFFSQVAKCLTATQCLNTSGGARHVSCCIKMPWNSEWTVQKFKGTTSVQLPIPGLSRTFFPFAYKSTSWQCLPPLQNVLMFKELAFKIKLINRILYLFYTCTSQTGCMLATASGYPIAFREELHSNHSYHLPCLLMDFVALIRFQYQFFSNTEDDIEYFYVALPSILPHLTPW